MLLDAADHAEPLYALLLPFADRTAADIDEGDVGSVQRPLGLLAGVLGRADAGAAHLRAAVEHNDAIGYRPWAAWSRLSLGRLTGDRALIDAARATAQELGMRRLEVEAA